MKILTHLCLMLGLIGFFACNQPPQSQQSAEATVAAKGESFRNKVGLQLYSLRNQLKSNVDSSLQFVKSQGITDVELAGYYGMKPEEFKAKLEQYGLKASSTGFGMKQLKDSIDMVIAQAQLFGCQYVMCAWIDHKGDTITLAEIQEGAKVFNEAGKKLKAKGIQFCYHPHGFEFKPHGEAGKTLFDVLYETTDPEAVKFEEDLLWATHGGVNAFTFLEKYGKRTELLHIKDLNKDVKLPKYTGREDVENDVVWGTGQVAVKAACQKAVELGVKHFFLEDESSRVLQQIPQSLKYAEGF
jgi:sugar phosphate isomerase/epimerase